MFPAGPVLTDEDQVGATFGVVVEGRAAGSVHGRPARNLGPGDYFGEMALIDHSHRSAPLRRRCAACSSSRGCSVPSPWTTLSRRGLYSR
jgi:CRP-like cAMP-binding protein